MSVKSLVGNVVAFVFLGFSGLGVAGVAWGLGTMVLSGPSGPGLITVLTSAGLAMTTGAFGWYLRKAIAGQVLPIDVDRSIAYRGGSGGL